VPLTNRDDVRDSLMDSVFARGDLSKAMPKYQFPDRESFPADVFQVIHDELLLDSNARQNLATFCQTWEEPEIHKIMDLAIDGRQGRVSADGRNRIAVRAHACGSVELP
jgi:glutamate decarboxylase